VIANGGTERQTSLQCDRLKRRSCVRVHCHYCLLDSASAVAIGFDCAVNLIKWDGLSTTN
jgi:hypothetical protein